MSNQRLLQAPEAAFTGDETNSRAQVFERLSDEFTLEISDSMPYGGSYFGRDEFVGLRKAVAKESTYFRYDVHEIIAAGDTIVVPVRADAFSIHGIPLLNERLFLFKVKDGRAVFERFYADTARGRDVISGHAHRHCPQPDLSDHTSPLIE
jgi:ketosteroid isomerase-like protein